MRRSLWTFLLGLILLIPTAASGQADDDDSAGDDDDSAGDDDDSAEPTQAPAPEPEPNPMGRRLDELDLRVDELARRVDRPERARRRVNIPRLKLNMGGRIQSDVRFRLKKVSVGDWYHSVSLPAGFSRNENIARFHVDAEISRFKGVVDLDFVLIGLPPDPDGLPGLSDRTQLHPYRFEAHAAYIQARDLLLKGLDVRIGQQLVQWGQGDQFNPTNLLNADDLEDPLLFGDQQANLMVRLDYTLLDLWTFSAVAVPTFRPALLPESAQLGLASVSRLPFHDEELRWRIHSETELAREALGYPTIVGSTRVELPEFNLRNMQLGFRVAGTVVKQDIAVSFYRGFDDFPVAAANINTLNVDAAACELDPPPPMVREDEPDEDEDCIAGLIETETVLQFPRLHVLGLNMAGEIPGVGIGYRLELGVFFPQERRLAIYNPEIPPFTTAGEYDYDGDGEPGGPEQPVVGTSRVYAKWAVGLDYRIGGILMLNAQWVHGLPDESGSGDFLRPAGGWSVRGGKAVGYTPAEADGRPILFDCATGGKGGECAEEILRPKIADYLVFGVDLSFARNAGLLRVFTLWDLSGYYTQSYDVEAGERINVRHHPFSSEGFSAVIYPEFQYNFGYGFELHVGALFQLGREHTKFGDPAGGGHQVFLRGRYSF